VSGGEGVGKGAGDLDDLLDRQASGGDHAIERLSFDQLHGEEVDAFDFFDRKDGDDVGMVEGGDSAGFALEAGETLGIAGYVRRQDFQGYVAAEFGVGGAIYLAHAAGADGGGDPVVRECAADQNEPPGTAAPILHQAGRLRVRGQSREEPLPQGARRCTERGWATALRGFPRIDYWHHCGNPTRNHLRLWLR